ncbi:MAG: DNA recombination/repair protein RecA, partial [Caldilineaceae bacterium SB0668_bin_21]|nr:DNA recombination/repair protein RecA [Caldilineaceae bacterium SB0668_bin_21]
RTRVTVRKNKVAAPFKVAEFDIMYNEGVSTQGDLLDLGVEFDIVEKRGAFYRFGDLRLGQGRESAKAFLSDKTDVAAQIDSKIRKQAGLPINLALQEEAKDAAEQDSEAGSNSQEKLFAEAA